MPDLQTSFYVIAIIFMIFALVLLVTMVVAVIVIRSKITAIHKNIDDKLATISAISERGSAMVDVLKKVSEKVLR